MKNAGPCYDCKCEMWIPDERAAEVPTDPVKAFAFLVSKCASGLLLELMAEGKTETQARNRIIYHFLDFAAGEACRIARRENREPDPTKWERAVNDAFKRAVKRTAMLSVTTETDHDFR